MEARGVIFVELTDIAIAMAVDADQRGIAVPVTPVGSGMTTVVTVITSYSIHYTKLYEGFKPSPSSGELVESCTSWQ